MRYLLHYNSGTVSAPAWKKAGMHDLNAQLLMLCREAAWLGRTPVFPRIAPLLRHHNFDIPCNFPLSKYLDTENIELVCKLDGKARILTLRAIHEGQLQALDIPPGKTLEIAFGQPVTAEQNRRFCLVTRRFSNVILPLRYGPLLAESFAHDSPPVQDLEHAKKKNALPLTLHPSPEVAELAGEIIRQLPPDYYAVHIRRGDMLQINPCLKTLTSPKAVSRALAQAGVVPDAPLYLMSDEKNRRWLQALRKQWPGMLHYTDFPRLVELVHAPRKEADNYFLFCVEQQILQHAAKAFHTRKAWLHENTGLQPIEYIVPYFMYNRSEVEKVYHPAEYQVLRGIKFGLFLRRRQSPLKKITGLVEHYAAWNRDAMTYCATRLLAQKNLGRYRNRGKALNIRW